MSPAEYGVITDIYALIPFALVVLTMGMESGYFRFAAKAVDEEERRRVYGTTWGIVTLVASVFLGIVLLFEAPISATLGYAGQDYVWITALIIFLDVAGAIPFARLRQEGRAGRYVSIRLLSVIVNIGLCLWFYNGQPEWCRMFSTATDPGYAFVANLVASGLTFILLLVSCKGAHLRIHTRTLKTIFLYSLPLLISGIAGTANEFIDRQMIKFMIPA